MPISGPSEATSYALASRVENAGRTVQFPSALAADYFASSCEARPYHRDIP